MFKWRVYLKPYDINGALTDWVDVSEDVDFDSLGAISSDLDNTDYDIGVFRTQNFKLNFNNAYGRYSDVGNFKSIFRYKRADTPVKITLALNELGGDICGTATAGQAFLDDETIVFEGLINDDSLAMDLENQKLSFTCLGRESLLDRCLVPYSEFYAGMTVKNALYIVLNQSPIRDFLAVGAAYINPTLNLVLDSYADLENMTVKEAVSALLEISNSVLVVKNDSIYIVPREANAISSFNFYGQASQEGVENILNIKQIKNGAAKAWNFWTWADASNSASDMDSINVLGVRKRELSSSLITNSTKINSILASYLLEFKSKKQEFDLYTPLTKDVLAVGLLDRVTIDYPTVFYSTYPLPICGIAVCGAYRSPIGQWDFQIVYPENEYKVLSKSVDAKNSAVKFRMRKV